MLPLRPLLAAILAFTTCAVAEAPGYGPYWDFVTAWDQSSSSDAYRDTDNSGTLAWGEAYNLRVLLSAYRLTDDPYWLGRIADHADSILAHAKDVPDVDGTDPIYADGYRGWGSSAYSDQPYDEFMVHDGHVCTPIAAYIAEVFQNPGLWAEYGERAAAQFDTLEKHVAAKWIASWDAERGTGITLRDFGGFEHLPHNQYQAFGSFLVFMNDVVNTPKWAELNDYAGEAPPNTYLPYVEEMGQFMKDDLRYDSTNDAYRWGYWPGGTEEDISHSNLTMEFIWYLYDHGIVFDDVDVRRFANTMSRLMWTGDLANVEINKYNHAGYEYEWTSRVWGWAYFIDADPLLFHIFHNYYRHRTKVTSPYELTAAVRTWTHAGWVADSAGAAVAPVSALVVDDGDRVIRPDEDADLRVTFKNFGIAAANDFDFSIAGYENTAGTYLEADSTFTEDWLSVQLVNPPDDLPIVPIPVWAEVEWLLDNEGSPLTCRIENAFPVHFGDPDVLYVTNEPVEDVLVDQEIERYLPGGAAQWLRTDADTLSNVPLGNFGTLFWRAAWALPTTGECAAMAAFLDGGGKLVLTGGDGALERWLHRSEADSLFFANYLHITDVVNLRDEIEGMRVRCGPVDAAVFSGMGTSQRDIGRSTDSPRFGVEVMRYEGIPETWTATVTATDPADNSPIDLPYETGGLGVDSTYSAVVLGWDFSQLTNILYVQKAMNGAFGWVDLPTGIANPALPGPAQPLRVSVAPNPFNPATRIGLIGVVPGEALIVRIVAANGQVIRTLRAHPNATAVDVVWDGADGAGRAVGSGMYVVRAEQTGVTGTVRQAVSRLTIVR